MAGRCGHKLLLGLGGISPTEFMTKFRWSNEAGRVDYAHPKTSHTHGATQLDQVALKT